MAVHTRGVGINAQERRVNQPLEALTILVRSSYDHSEFYFNQDLQSRTDKVDQNNVLELMPPKTIGIDTNPRKALPGQFSARSIEPFFFKLPV